MSQAGLAVASEMVEFFGRGGLPEAVLPDATTLVESDACVGEGLLGFTACADSLGVLEEGRLFLALAKCADGLEWELESFHEGGVARTGLAAVVAEV